MKRISALLATLLLSAYASASLSEHSLLLMGEVHDNAAGHAARFKALEQAVQQGWRPAIAMEQFDRERQADLDLARKAQPDNPDYLIQQAGGSRWDWPLYRPVIALALRYDLPLIAANLSRQDAAKVVREGLAADPSILPSPLPAGLLAAQREAIRSGHCGQMPENMLDGMALAQIARDSVMARLMLPYQPRGVVLLAGNGHVRRDLGVPQWLPQAWSWGFVESAGTGEFDREEIIAPASRPDPCAALPK